MRGWLWGWTIVWAAAWGVLFAFMVLFLILAAKRPGSPPGSQEHAIFCMMPIWFLLLVVPGVKLVASWHAELQRIHAPVVGRCAACGYDTEGLAGLCPECGSPVETAAWESRPKPRSFWGRVLQPPTRKGLWRWTFLWAAGLAGLVTYLLLLFGTTLFAHRGPWVSGAALFPIPVWCFVVIAAGFEVAAMWRLELRRPRRIR